MNIVGRVAFHRTRLPRDSCLPRLGYAAKPEREHHNDHHGESVPCDRVLQMFVAQAPSRGRRGRPLGGCGPSTRQRTAQPRPSPLRMRSPLDRARTKDCAQVRRSARKAPRGCSHRITPTMSTIPVTWSPGRVTVSPPFWTKPRLTRPVRRRQVGRAPRPTAGPDTAAQGGPAGIDSASCSEKRGGEFHMTELVEVGSSRAHHARRQIVEERPAEV